MKEIADAIAVRQAQIRTLQGDIDALQRAASALAGGKTTTAKASRQKTTSQPKVTQKGRGMSAAARKAVSETDEGVLGEAEASDTVARSWTVANGC